MFVITNSDRAGAQMHLRYLIEYLSGKYEIYLLSGTHGYLSEYAESKEIPIRILNSMGREVSLMNDFRAMKELRSWFKGVKPDIVHLHSSKAGFLGRFSALGLNTKVIYTVHGWAFSPGNKLFKRIFSWCMEMLTGSMADYRILVSKFDEALAERLKTVNKYPMSVVYNGVPDCIKTDHSDVKPKLNCHLVNLARFAPQKNLACLVDAFALLKADTELTIGGSGPDFEETVQKIKRLSLLDHIHTPGEIENVCNFLKKTDIFVLSSNWEGLPIALIEACRAGMPIIATNVGGVSEIVFHGVNGLLVEPNNPQALASAIDQLTSDLKLRVSMGLKSRAIYEKHYKVEYMVEKTDQIYQLLLAKG